MVQPIHLSTIFSHSTSGILGQISRLSAKYGKRGHTVLFALSANFPHSADLQRAVDQLTRFNGVPQASEGVGGEPSGSILGCLTDSFAGVSFQKLASTGAKKHETGSAGVLSCSIGIFDSTHCVPFRSELAGRAQPQVGRWHAFRKKDDIDSEAMDAKSRLDWERMKDSADGKVNWENIWHPSSSTTSLSSLLPESLQKVDSSKFQNIISLSSSHPDTFTRALTDCISLSNQATALTLVAAPTHFITGRGVTLFMNGQIHGEGAVGLAFLHDGEQANSRQSSFRTEFVGMKKLSGSMTVTSREGNMINSLNDSNPTRQLLGAIDLAGIGATKEESPSPFAATFKDDEQFALGLLSPGGEILETYKITAGDPSSRGGSLSLDAPRAPEVGSVVQFLHCPANAQLSVSPSLLPASKKTIVFLTVPELVASNDATENIETDRICEDAFMASSTQGFVVSRPAIHSAEAKSEPWSSSLPGGIALLQW